MESGRFVRGKLSKESASAPINTAVPVLILNRISTSIVVIEIISAIEGLNNILLLKGELLNQQKSLTIS